MGLMLILLMHVIYLRMDICSYVCKITNDEGIIWLGFEGYLSSSNTSCGAWTRGFKLLQPPPPIYL